MLYSVEDLVINDSFIAYCMQPDAGDRSFWDEYLEQHPEALPTVEEARLLVLGLKLMLQKKQNELSAGEDKNGHGLYVPDVIIQQMNAANDSGGEVSRKRKWAWAIGAAACVIVVLGVFYQSRQPVTSQKAVETVASTADPVQSKAGELKTLELPDHSTITLNMGSSLKLSEGFAHTNRDVYLDGEAFFEVTHNKNLPFVVHVKDYKVRVLGTRFNVKAYKNDRLSETSLLEGSVQIIVNKNGKDEVYKTLEVNQKFTTKADSSTLTAIAKNTEGAVVPLSYYDEKQAVETAWTKDLLIFEGRSMDEIKNILERKFGVTITIADKKVQQYLYSANFTNESIDEILKALQLSYPFSYKKEGNTIIINK
jgi:ferric-dicitrate binding protein FerR (iron transport regulator)